MASSTLQLANKLLVGEILKRTSHRTPHAEAFVFNDKRITFQELDERATAIAGWLQTNGISKNDKVAFMLKNSIAFSEITFGTALSGGVSVPINFRLGVSEVAYILNNSESKIVFIDEEYSDIFMQIKDQIQALEKIIVVGNNQEPSFLHYESIFSEKSRYLPCETLSDDDPSFIMYTSGTTGKSKGAVLSHRSIFMNAMNITYEGDARVMRNPT